MNDHPLAIKGYHNRLDLAWRESIVLYCQSKLASTLKQPVIVPPPPAIIVPKLLKKLGRFNFALVYFPALDIHIDFRIENGTWIKPNKWFYLNLGPDKIDPAATKIKPGWHAIDLTSSVNYADGIQVFPNDPLEPLITRLRQEKKIGGFDKTPIGSRFAITGEEWEDVIAPALAQAIGLEPSQATVRLERAIEFNLVGNVYDKPRGKFNAWEWFADLYGLTDRLHGGFQYDGGLSVVSHRPRGDRLDSFAGRLIIDFSQAT